jgi:hypothetical protein
MKLIIEGVVVDSTKEYNLINNRLKFGYDALVIFKKGSIKDIPGKKTAHLWHNLNEVHNRWNDYEMTVNPDEKGYFEFFHGPKIAFESDKIHRSGGWRLVNEIECVIVYKSTKRHDDVCEVIELMMHV